MIDFSDMEQFALAILTRNTEGKSCHLRLLKNIRSGLPK